MRFEKRTVPNRSYRSRIALSFVLVGSIWTLLILEVLLSDASLVRLITFAVFALTFILSMMFIWYVFEEIKDEKRISELNTVRSEFLYVASHQLRTPVSVITGNLSLLAEGAYDKKPKAQLRRVYESMFHKAKKLTNTVNGILMASHMDNFDVFKLPINHMQPVDIREIVRNICETLEYKADEKQLTFDYTAVTASDEPVYVKSTGNYLEQAIMNVIDNALTYTHKGFVRVLFVRTRRSISIAVTDTGIGIPKEDQENVFTKFERSPNAERTYADGSGLGLFVARKIIEAHSGGKIGFVSAGEGKGTTFSIEIKTL